MRKFLFILSSIAFISCSNDDNVQNETESALALTSIERIGYDPSTTPSSVAGSINYVVENNKIVSHNSSSENTSANYSYDNGKLSKIEYYLQGNLAKTETFDYNSEGNLIEFRTNGTDGLSRHIFTHTEDTIFAQHQGSSDGVNFDVQLADLKIVLDENDNRTYFEILHLNNSTMKIEKSIFDGNNNPIEESFFENGSSTPYITNTITYTSTLNPLSSVYETTYGRETLMLLYHLQADAINHINSKIISQNAISSFNTTFGDGSNSFSVDNVINEEGNLEVMDIKTLVGSEVFSHFAYQFNYE